MTSLLPACYSQLRNSITLGMGIPFTAENSIQPVYLFGGEVQVSNSAKLLTENWLLTSDENLLFFLAWIWDDHAINGPGNNPGGRDVL